MGHVLAGCRPRPKARASVLGDSLVLAHQPFEEAEHDRRNDEGEMDQREPHKLGIVVLGGVEEDLQEMNGGDGDDRPPVRLRRSG